MSEKCRTVFSVVTVILFLIAGTAGASKPSAPLQISIVPLQKDIVPSDIKPGDYVKMAVIIRSLTDSPEMNIKIQLQGGAELVSGDTAWTGPVRKGETRSLLLTVRAPFKGTGKIKARVSISAGKGAAYASEARYVLGGEEKRKSSSLPPVKKDSRGRSIREFR